MRALAAVVCVVLIGYLFWRDLRKPGRDSISWVPFVWMFIAGSRFVSHWLTMRTPGGVVEAYSEGSSVDRAVFFLLILWGSVVLAKRNIQWGQLLSSNKWIVAYFVFCLVSLAWSTEPTIVARRWVKDLGNPIMALVLLTERKPYEAIVVTLRRLAFVWMPISILFIRYYPEFGRGYAAAGGLMYSGIADQKNTLGLSCLVVGICCVWTLLLKRDSADRYDLLTGGMVAWLLYASSSKTSLACLIAAVLILVGAALSASWRQPTRIMTATLCIAALYFAGDAVFNIKDYFLMMLDRDPTLTNRTEVWDIVLSFSANPVFGAGFMSFWTGDRMRAVWTALGSPINQAHNGYLEQYLNLGYVGVAFIGVITVAALSSVRSHLRIDYPAGVLRFCFIVVALLYNYTEASFYGMNNMWVLFLAASIDRPQHLGDRVSVPVVLRSTTAGRLGTRRRRWGSRRRRALAAQEISAGRPTGPAPQRGRIGALVRRNRRRSN
jgi:exopolysaccharide production protein ExoQ